MRAWIRKSIGIAAVLYPIVLVAVILAFRFVGERWWVSAVGLFLPRIGFALPLVILGPALVLFKLRRLYSTLVLSGWLLLFPLMGLVVPFPRLGQPAPTLRLMSFNANTEYSGAEEVGREIFAHSPDIVVLQESADWSHIGDVLRRRYSTVHESTQFLLATNLRLVSATDPPRISYEGHDRSPRFMRYSLATPRGALTLYSVHPISPRQGFYALRGNGLKREIGSGRLLEGENSGRLAYDAGLRMAQVRAFAAMARLEHGPTIIAGDTNQPGLAATFYSELGDRSDAFEQAGAGFGYTFPAHRPWMRIDRILLTPELRAVSFETGCRGVSDHLCVVADIAQR